MLGYARTKGVSTSGFNVLDYGCGEGAIVKLLRINGVNCFGCDIYYEGASYSDVKDDLISLGYIQVIDEQSELPYPTEYFDVIIANQVFEHVRDFENTINRLIKCLKRDGIIYLHFPTKEVLREGHIGIPLAHRFSKDSKLRYYYVLFLRYMGLGYFKKDKSPKLWTKDALQWIDTYCYYRRNNEVRRMLENYFVIKNVEIDYIKYRAKSPALNALFSIKVLKNFYEGLFRLLGFNAYELRLKS